jgi:hypothetical protein
LFDVRQDFATGVIAWMSRHLPGVLLRAYRLKCALSRRARATITNPRPTSAGSLACRRG